MDFHFLESNQIRKDPESLISLNKNRGYLYRSKRIIHQNPLRKIQKKSKSKPNLTSTYQRDFIV